MFYCCYKQVYKKQIFLDGETGDELRDSQTEGRQEKELVLVSHSKSLDQVVIPEGLFQTIFYSI